MSDEGMDPCECVWGHEMAMRRLLSFLRQSQTVCTDSECFDDPIGRSPEQTTPDNSFLMMSLMIMFAIALYIMRPRALTSSSNEKRNSDYGSNNGTPPSAPPPASF